MYSRYHDRNGAPLRVPEHYSGYAFSKGANPNVEQPPRRMDIAKPTPPPVPPQSTMPPPPRPALPPPHEAPLHEQPPHLPTPAPTAPLQLAGIPLFSHGIGFEELLLLGLIVLLWGTEGGSDMVLWLVLLLFLG